MTNQHRTKLPANGRSMASATGRALHAARARTAEEEPASPVAPEAGADVTVAAPTDEVAVEQAPAEDVTVNEDEVTDEAVVEQAPAEDVTVDEPGDVAEPAEDEPEANPAPATAHRFPVPVVAAAVITTAALVFAIIAGVLWWRAGHDNSARALASARDDVALQGRLDVAAVNTLDYQQAAASYAKWLSVSTGTLHQQYVTNQKADVAFLAQAQINTSATVLAAAVTQLSMSKGTATVIVSVNVKHQPAKGSAQTVRNRFSASMQRVHGVWKMANVTIVAVQLS